MPASERAPNVLRLALPDEAATAALARALAALARVGDVIALGGELGAGKTSLVIEEVPSPTFTLVQIYEREPAPVWHFDLFRLEHPQEVHELGLEEALSGGITLIEWPERLGPLLPPERLEVRLHFAEDPGARRAELVADGDWRKRLASVRLSGLRHEEAAAHG
jgi:tRNA threonylcarbamoyladenosine biosynthesis protein TsaE